MKIVSFANPISCQLNPTLRNIRKFTQNDGEGKELGGRERWTVKSRGKRKKKRKSAKERDRKKVKGWREKWKLGTIEILLQQSIKAWIGHGPLSLTPMGARQ